MRTGVVEWAAAESTLPGEPESGDRHVVIPNSDRVLIAVVDGAGHGREAAAAAKLAVRTIAANSEDGLASLVERCHDRLRGTRGVVMSAASFDAADRTMAWLGVGNVEGRLLRKTPQPRRCSESLLLRPGLLGQHLPTLRSRVLPMGRGDMVILATDGVSGGFAEQLDPKRPLQELVDDIIARYSQQTDDALVLAARYVG